MVGLTVLLFRVPRPLRARSRLPKTALPLQTTEKILHFTSKKFQLAKMLEILADERLNSLNVTRPSINGSALTCPPNTELAESHQSRPKRHLNFVSLRPRKLVNHRFLCLGKLKLKKWQTAVM